MSERKLKKIGSNLKNGSAKLQKIFAILEKKAIFNYYRIEMSGEIFEIPCSLRPSWIKYKR